MAMDPMETQNIIDLEQHMSKEEAEERRQRRQGSKKVSKYQDLKSKIYSKIYRWLVWDTVDF